LCALQISHTIDVLHSVTHISIQKELTVKKRKRKEKKQDTNPYPLHQRSDFLLTNKISLATRQVIIWVSNRPKV
jgi:hypothetical protein